MSSAIKPVSEGHLITAFPAVALGVAATPLTDQVRALLTRVVVDSALHGPDMFELTFHDRDSRVLADTGIAIGTPVTISATAAGRTVPARLLVGEVTAIEGVFAELNQTIVRGYSADHRLHRVRRTRTFVNMKDSDIARKVAADAGLTVGVVEQTTTAHEHVGQVNQTD